MLAKVRKMNTKNKIISSIGMIGLVIATICGYQIISENQKIDSMKKAAIIAAKQYLEENGIETTEAITTSTELLSKTGYLEGFSDVCAQNSYVVTEGEHATATIDCNVRAIPSAKVIVPITASTVKEPSIKTKGNVLVTVTVSEAVKTDTLEAAGWTATNNNMTFSKVFKENGTETIQLISSTTIGKEKEYTVVVNNIDRIIPTVSTQYNILENTKEDVVAVISADEELQELAGWTLSNDKLSLSKVYSINTNETVIVKDIAGNEANVHVVIANIDKEAPVVNESDIIYSEKNPTNENVTVTIRANEKLQELAGWTLSNDKLSLSKVFTANEKQTIVIQDLVGNKTSVKIDITNIDKEAPMTQISLNPQNPTNGEVVVTITSNEKMQEVNGWSLSSDGLSMSKTYITNTNDIVIVRDVLGNAKEITIDVTNIDQNIPSVFFNDVGGLYNKNVTLKIYGEDVENNISAIQYSIVKDGIAGEWKERLLESLDLTLSEEGIYTVQAKVQDKAGNWSTVKTSSIIIIDQTKAEVNVAYDNKNLTNQNVTVTLTSNEKLQGLEGWSLSSDKLSMTKVYENNINEVVTVLDEAGNATNVTIEIDNIDRTPASITVGYSIVKPSKGPITVTLTSNKKLQEIEGWSLSSDKLSMTKIYENNTNEVVTVLDEAGNTTNVTVEITNIDLTKPEISYTLTPSTITNGNVLVTFVSNEKMNQELQEKKQQGWIFAEDGMSMTKEYTQNTVEAGERIVIYDEAGNFQAKVLKITNIDKVAPVVVGPIYSEENLTNGDVLVTIIAGEPVQPIEGWTITEDLIKLTKVYTENSKETLLVKDIAGNVTEVNVEINNIDKEFNAPEVSYSITKPTNGNVTVTIKSDEVMQELAGWTLSEDKLSMSKEYSENGKTEVTVLDIAGNSQTVTISINNIDKEFNQPTVNYSTKEITNGNVIVTIISDEVMQELEGWLLSEDKLSMSKEYSENVEREVVYVLDEAGNRKAAVIKINNIDKISAEATVSYSKTTLTNKNVIVKITANEKLQEIEGWTLASNKLTLSKVVEANESATVFIKDIAGNVTEVSYSVNNIDKEFNVPEVSYSIKKPTNGNVTVTITADEVMQEIEGWTLSEDGLSMTREYSENVEREVVYVLDEAGNRKAAVIKINNIDRTFELPQITYSTLDPTNKTVVVTITSTEKMQELEGWTLASNQLRMTKKYTENTVEEVTVLDIAGNSQTVTISINNIDKEFNQPTVNYSTKEITNGNVIVTIISDEVMQELEGWLLSEDKLSMSKEYSENVEREVVYVLDEAGNRKAAVIKINNIDKISAEATVSYSKTTLTNKNVIVKITANEKLQEIEGWTLASNKLTLSKVVEANESATVFIKDIAGNVTEVSYSVNNIDKEFNQPVVSYSIKKVTNGNVIVTITADEVMQEIEGWTLSEDGLSMTREYSENVEREVVYVYDLAGNRKAVVVKIHNIDKEFNAPEVSYSITEPTNGNVTVTIKSDELMRKLAGWTLSEDKLSMSKEYSENGKTEVTVLDIAGNSQTVTISINNIDKEFNAPEVSYSTTEPTNGNVTVTITADETMQELEGWTLSEDKLSMSKEYSENEKTEVTVLDIAGNSQTVTISINNIDKEFNVPEVSYSITEPTNGNVTVTITADEVMQELEGWTLSEDKLSMSKEYSENGKTEVTVLDIAGNSQNVTISINNIDKEFNAPEVSYSITKPTNGNVTVTITADEVMQELAGWTLSEDKLSMSKEYSENGKTEVTVLDIAGNSQTVTISINNIDKVSAELSVHYSTTEPTNGNVIVFVQANEKITVLGDNASLWTLSEDRMSVVRTYLENIEEELTVQDAAGNQTTITISIQNIDKTGPELRYEVDHLEMTNQNVMVTIFSNEKMQELEGWTLSEDKLSMSKEYSQNIEEVVTVKDILGNSSSITITIENIDKEAPTVTGVEDNHFYNTSVTISYNEGNATLNGNPFMSGDTVELEGEYTLIVTDDASNTTTVHFVIDMTAPSLTVDGHTDNYNIVVENNQNGIFEEPTVTVEDNFTTNLEVQKTGSVDVTKVGNYTLTYHVQDEAGNQREIVVTVEVKDTTAPIIETEVLTQVGKNGWYNVPVQVKVTGTDFGTGVQTYQYKLIIDGVEDTEYKTITMEDGEAIFTINENSQNVKFQVIAVDNASNVSETYISETYQIDFTKPTITYEVVEEQTGSLLHKNPISVIMTGQDNLSGIASYQYAVSIDNGTTWSKWTTVTGEKEFNIEEESNQIVFKVRAIDVAGNIGRALISTTYTYDKTAPIITVSVEQNGEVFSYTDDFEMTVQATHDQIFTYPSAQVTDNYSENLEATVVGEVNLSQTGDYVITYKAVDAAMNERTVKGTIHVIDTTAPNLSVLETKGEEIITHTENFKIQVEVSKTEPFEVLPYQVTDNYDAGVTVQVENTVDRSKLGTYTVVYTASDRDGNTSQIQMTVEVKDTIAPILTVKEIKNGIPVLHVNDFEITVEADRDKTFTYLDATAFDNYDESLEVSVSGEVSLKQVGTYKVTYQVTDSSNNEAVIHMTVKVVDTTAPTITVLENKNGETIEHNQDFTIEVETSKTESFENLIANALDNHDENVTVTASGIVDMTTLGTYTVTYQAIDSANNESSLVMTVKVIDAEKPNIVLNGEESIQVPYGIPYQELGATVTDNYDQIISAEISGNVNVYQLGSYIVTYKAVDKSGNQTTLTRTVTVVPTETSDIFRNNNTCEETGTCYNTLEKNNYIWYSGYLWRVISVNEDNTVKLVTEDSIAGFSYDDDSSKFSGSIVESWLMNEFYPTLNNKTTIVTTAPYCNQMAETTLDKRTTCDSNSIIYSKVGLLTMDEYNILGADKSFLNTGDQFFTMTITGARNVWTVDYNGIAQIGHRVTNTYAIRPVITISADTQIRSGKGTMANPYRFVNDTSAKAGASLNTRYTGEYVRFANQNWRIVKTGSVTRLVLDSLYKVDGETQKQTFGTAGDFNLTTGIGNYLNDTVYNALFNEAEKQVMTKWNMYNSTYQLGADPRKTSLVASGTRIEAYVGLNYVGSILSGNSSTARLSGVTGWLMNYNNTNGEVWYTSTGGTTSFAPATDIRGVKPVIALKSEVTILSGNGTSTDPYILNY